MKVKILSLALLFIIRCRFPANKSIPVFNQSDIFLEAEEMEEDRLIRELKEKDAKRHPDLPWVELAAIAEEVVDGQRELEKEKKTDQGLLTQSYNGVIDKVLIGLVSLCVSVLL